MGGKNRELCGDHKVHLKSVCKFLQIYKNSNFWIFCFEFMLGRNPRHRWLLVMAAISDETLAFTHCTLNLGATESSLEQIRSGWQ